MKVKIGMKVAGQIDVGVVTAMSRDWCIYQPRHGEEVAEPWGDITLLHDGPEATVSGVSDKEIS